MARQGTPSRTRSRGGLNPTCGFHQNIDLILCINIYIIFWIVAVPHVDIDHLEGLRTQPCRTKNAAGTGAHFCAAAPRQPCEPVGGSPKTICTAATRSNQGAASRSPTASCPSRRQEHE